MSRKTFSLFAGLIFFLVAVMHGVRLALRWEAVVNGWSVPMWVSALALLVAGYLAFEGLMFGRGWMKKESIMQLCANRNAEASSFLNTNSKTPILVDDQTLEVLMREYDEHAEQGRHSESERSMITSIIVAASAAVFTYLGAKEFAQQLWPVSLVITFLGLYGLIMSLKLHERFRYHMEMCKAFRSRIDWACPEAKIRALRDCAKKIHTGKQPLMEGFRLNKLWLIFNISLSIAGIIAAYLIYARCPKI